MRIAAVDPEALVAFFPSDHYISDDEKFMSHIRTALDTASQRSDLVMLLGLDPKTPEVEYGWIEPSEPIWRQSRIYGVRRFWEKPNLFLAQVLPLRGCLWNSFVMVASVQALLGTIESAIPQLYDSFVGLSPFLGRPEEPRLIDRFYERMVEVNFSHQVLGLRPERLAVLKVIGVRWNDLGEPSGSWHRSIWRAFGRIGRMQSCPNSHSGSLRWFRQSLSPPPPISQPTSCNFRLLNLSISLSPRVLFLSLFASWRASLFLAPTSKLQQTKKHQS
jgi:mannose-1-phosphate guanylyltransferase